MSRTILLKLYVGASSALFFLGSPVPSAWCAKKSSKSVTTANGRPIRKVLIRGGSPDMTSSAVTQLTQDTCLTTVSDIKQADAVLEVGVALPSIEGDGLPSSDGFDSSAHPPTMGGKTKQKPERSFSATCSNGKETGGCASSYAAPMGGVAQPAAEWSGNIGSQLDVSLASVADASQELWEPDGRSKKSWSEQLRAVAGCPVCPGEHFNRKQYPSYRQWIEARCPAVLAAP